MMLNSDETVMTPQGDGSRAPEIAMIREVTAPAASNIPNEFRDWRINLLLRWSLHWASATLVIALLLKSIPSSLSLSGRPFDSAWLEFHLSIGLVLFVATIARCWLMITGGLRSLRTGQHRSSARRMIHWLLLYCALFLGLTGTLIYQTPPLSKGVTVLGITRLPTLIRLDHGLHGKIIALHIAGAAVLLGLVLYHIWIGTRSKGPGARPPLFWMLWPWR